MAIEIEHVQRGELITADLINQLIDDIENLDARVTTLEQAGTTSGVVEIDALYPTTPRVEDDVTIIGKNFGYSVGATRIYFNGLSPSTLRQGSSDTVLVCPVPDIPGLAESGSAVQLTVANARSSATESITVLPLQQEQVGDASIDFSGVSPDPTVPNQNADFAFTLHSDALLPAKMKLKASLKDIEGAPLGWNTALLDAAFNPLENDQIQINPTDTKPFYVRVGIPSGQNNTPFTLQADGAGGGLTASSGPQSLVVGQTASPDDAIPDLSPTSVSNGTLSGSTVSVTPGSLAELDLEVHFTVASTYNVSVSTTGGGWQAQLLVPSPTNPQFNVGASDLNQGTSPKYAKETIRVLIATSGSTPGTTHAVVTVQRQGQTKKRTYGFDITIPAT
jgi:IPT/TIG domain